MKEVTTKFDERSRNWSPHPEINKLFVTNVFSYSRDRLMARGHLFLNEVLEELGLPKTSEGQLIGWLYPEKEKRTWWEMLTSTETDDIVLKFYTDGVMYDKIEETNA